MESNKFTTMADVPVIDLKQYLDDRDSDVPSDKTQELCKEVVSSLHKYGILIVRDPRVDFNDNKEYIDAMEKYFAQ